MWHSRTGHISLSKLVHANTRFKLGISGEALSQLTASDCIPCVQGKATRKAIRSAADTQYRATDILGCLHCDLVGPISISTSTKRKQRLPTYGGKLYTLTIVDEFSRFVIVVLLQHKSDVASVLIPLICRLQAKTGRILLRLHTDGGGEFRSNELLSFLIKNGTQYTRTTAETPAHNGVAERMNRTLFEMVRSMMSHASAPNELWGETVLWAAHVHNCMPQPTIDNDIPLQRLYNYKFNLNKLRVFGCDAHVLELDKAQSKIQPRTWTGIFTGFETESNSYRIFNPTTNRTVLTNDVTFHEQSFTECHKLVNQTTETPRLSVIRSQTNHSEIDHPISSPAEPIEQPNQIEGTAEEDDYPEETQEVEDQSLSPEIPILTSRYGRTIKPVSQYGRPDPRDYAALTVTCDNELDELAMMMHAVETTGDEPKTYREAMASGEKKQWLGAMKSEINSLKKQEAWELVPCPRDAKAIKGRWVFKRKLGDQNEVVRYKARFVAKGFLQVYGRDYMETHSPVSHLNSIKLVLAIVAENDMELRQMDFDTAFLNATLTEDVYVEQPDGFVSKSNPTFVCRLIKALYGLKQASREWYLEIDSFLKSLGFNPLICDPCVYIKITAPGRRIILCLYVDDTIAAYHKCDEQEWEASKVAIANRYAIKDLGECRWILNMLVSRNRTERKITLCQQAYVERIVKNFRLDQAKETNNPEKFADLFEVKDKTEPILLSIKRHELYRSIVGALLYAANTTRVDIAHIVGQLSRHVAKPYQHQLDAAKHTLRYLKGTSSLGLLFGGSNTITDSRTATPQHSLTAYSLTAYSDANWGGVSSPDGRKSTTGAIIKYNGNVISWISKQQDTVALSSTEAEYIAMSATAQEMLWYRSWFKEIFDFDLYGAMLMRCDNQSAKALASRNCYRARTKHIDIKYHHIRDHVVNKRILLEWISTDIQEADLLTKQLGTGRFTQLRDKLLTPI